MFSAVLDQLFGDMTVQQYGLRLDGFSAQGLFCLREGPAQFRFITGLTGRNHAQDCYLTVARQRKITHKLCGRHRILGTIDSKLNVEG